MKKIVFLCTGNSARSQMSEAWAKHLGAERANYLSAGTSPTSAVNPFAIVAMRERGIDLSDARPKTFDSIPNPIDLIVAVCSQAGEQCPRLGPEIPVERWDLPDPAAATGSEDDILKVFRASRDDIELRVRELIERI